MRAWVLTLVLPEDADGKAVHVLVRAPDDTPDDTDPPLDRLRKLADAIGLPKKLYVTGPLTVYELPE